MVFVKSIKRKSHNGVKRRLQSQHKVLKNYFFLTALTSAKSFWRKNRSAAFLGFLY